MKYIIFDADGVLIHSEMFSVTYQEQFGVPKEIMLPFFNGVFKDCIVWKADLKKEITPYLKQWGWEKSVEDFLSYWFSTEDIIDTQLIEYIFHLKTKAVQCYLATNQEKYRVEYMQDQMKFSEIFDGIFASSDIWYKKNQTDFYKHVLNHLEVKAEDILFVDDEIENIKIAKAAWFQCYKYENREDFMKYVNNFLSV